MINDTVENIIILPTEFWAVGKFMVIIVIISSGIVIPSDTTFTLQQHAFMHNGTY